MKKIYKYLTSASLLVASAMTAQAASILSVRDTITDPNIVYPESFEADTHLMMKNWYLQNYTTLDRGGSTNSYDAPVEASDEEIIARLMAMPTVIEMPFNSVVKSYINMYVNRRRSLVENMLGMSIYYMPIFEQALEAEGVPLELKYLPIIESALNPVAVSRAGATGLWQFMLPTARGLGMEINSLVDERRDPVCSSRMAAKYLRQLYDIYGDWSLAIAAYNCGPGNVNKALRRCGENGGKKDFWEIYPYLPTETRGYVPSFIAANYAMNYYDKHNISPVLACKPIITDSVHVKKRVHFQQIADVLGISVDELRVLNPQYRQDIIPGDIKAYPLVLPSHQALSYIISEDSIVAHNADKYTRRSVVEPSDGSSRVSDDGKYIITEEIKWHKVRKGETFSSIARRYGVTVSSIKKANGIKTLRRGRTIKIITTKRVPRPEEPADTVQQPADVELQPKATDDAIEAAENIQPAQEASDDTMILISETETVAASDSAAANFSVPQSAPSDTTRTECSSQQQPASSLQAEPSEARHRVESTFNSRKSSEPSANDTVVNPQEHKPAAPKAEKKKKTAPQPVYHKVKSGENLSKIARRYRTTVQKIQKLNNISGSKISIGQRIRVK